MHLPLVVFVAQEALAGLLETNSSVASKTLMSAVVASPRDTND